MIAEPVPVRVRRATPNDAVAVDAVYLDSWNEGFGDLLGRRAASADRLERWYAALSGGDVGWWVAERDGTVVGLVGLGVAEDPPNGTIAELDAIAVAPAHWRTGVGRALMELAVGQLSRRFDEAILWTPARYERGHAFYRATGWEADGAERADGAHVRFRRSLPQGPGRRATRG